VVPKQIPPRNGNFVDRKVILAAVKDLAGGATGNVTAVIKGLPRVGKSAVAVELMHRLHGGYRDGQLFCRLSDATPIPDLMSSILVALGDSAEDIPVLWEARHNRYLTKTLGLRLLIVIDGAVTAAQIAALEPADGRSLIVVTGRNSAADLSRGGQVFELDPFAPEDARELLTLIVGADRTAAEPAAVDRILVLCANMPFALCVVGSMLAQNPKRPIRVLADLLSDDQRRSTALSLPEVFDAAYRSLTDTARRCYRALGLRSYDQTLSRAALAAAVTESAEDIDWAAIELANLHLIIERDGGFGVIDLIRIHARGIDTTDAERETQENRVLDYFDRGLAAADSLIGPNRPWRIELFPDTDFPGPGTGEFTDVGGALDWMRREHDNMVAAAGYAFKAGQYALVVRWCVLLWPFQEHDKRLEAMQFMHTEYGIPAAQGLGMKEAESFLHTQLGYLHNWTRDAPNAITLFEEGVRLARSCPPSPLVAELEASAEEGLGLALLIGGEIDQARIHLRRSYDLAIVIDDGRRIALISLHRAKTEEPELALTLLAVALRHFVEVDVNEPANRAKILTWQGRKLIEQGSAEPALDPEPLLNEALTIMRQCHRRFDEAEILVALGEYAMTTGNRGSALGLYQAGREIYTELHFHDAAAAVDALIAAARER